LIPCAGGGAANSIDHLLSIADPPAQQIVSCQIQYVRGAFSEVKLIFCQLKGQPAARLLIADYALLSAISTGDFGFYRKLVFWLDSLSKGSYAPEIKAISELHVAAGYAGALKPELISPWIIEGEFSNIPLKLLPVACCRRVESLLSMQEYPMMLATAQTALGLIEKSGQYAISLLYLQLRVAMAHQHLGAHGQARSELQAALQSAVPFGFVTPFAETLPKFGGLIEFLTRKDYPDFHDAVIAVSRKCIPNWLLLKNEFPADKSFSQLSPTELEIAYCAARGETSRLIAKKFGLSEGTVNNKLQVIYDKLTITTNPPRKALVELML
jgi:hypothetical protein